MVLALLLVLLCQIFPVIAGFKGSEEYCSLAQLDSFLLVIKKNDKRKEFLQPLRSGMKAALAAAVLYDHDGDADAIEQHVFKARKAVFRTKLLLGQEPVSAVQSVVIEELTAIQEKIFFDKEFCDYHQVYDTLGSCAYQVAYHLYHYQQAAPVVPQVATHTDIDEALQDFEHELGKINARKSLHKAYKVMHEQFDATMDNLDGISKDHRKKTARALQRARNQARAIKFNTMLRIYQ